MNLQLLTAARVGVLRYNFIGPDNGSEDPFVHYSGIAGDDRRRRSLEEGNKLTYEITQGRKACRRRTSSGSLARLSWHP